MYNNSAFGRCCCTVTEIISLLKTRYGEYGYGDSPEVGESFHEVRDSFGLLVLEEQEEWL